MSMSEDYPIADRRKSMPSLDALDVRLRAVESWMDSFRLQMNDVASEVKANTRLTEDIHGKSEEMYEIFDATRNGFRMIASIGNFGLRIGRKILRVLEFLGRIAKPIFWIAAIGSAAVLWWKTGKFVLPEWWKWFL